MRERSERKRTIIQRDSSASLIDYYCGIERARRGLENYSRVCGFILAQSIDIQLEVYMSFPHKIVRNTNNILNNEKRYLMQLYEDSTVCVVATIVQAQQPLTLGRWCVSFNYQLRGITC